MSSGEKTSVDQAALASRIQSVKQDVLTVNQLLASARRVRLWIFLVVLVWLGAVLWIFLGMVNRVLSEEFRNELMSEAKGPVEDQTKRLTKEAKTLWDNAQPVLTEAVNKQREKDSERFTSTLEAQQDLLKENMEKRIKEELDKRYKDIVTKHRKLLETEFPVVKDEATHERMIENLSIAMQDLVEKYYFDEFKRQLERLDKTWEDFPMAEPLDPKEKDQPSLASQLVAELLELLPLLIAASHEQAEVQMDEASEAKPDAKPKAIPKAVPEAKPDAKADAKPAA